MRAGLAVALVVVCGAAGAWLACSSSRGSPATGNDASSDAVVGDAPPEGEGGGSGDGGTAGVGVLTFSEALDAGGTFFGGFATETSPASVPGCTVVDAGACTTTSCPPLAADASAGEAGLPDAAPVLLAPNPGTLHLTGGAFGDAGVTVAPDKVGTYLYVSPGSLFAPGDTLGVSAAGGQLAGFLEQTTVALPVAQLTAPVSDGGTLSIATAQPLTISWTGGQAGATLVLSATALFTTGGQATMTCGWDASSGTASVPSAALEPLAAENAFTSGLGWYQANSTRFTTGKVAVTLTAYIAQQVPASFQ